MAVMMLRIVSIATACWLVAMGAEKPVNLGEVGAGEGPAWHPSGKLYFSGRGNIMVREADGSVKVFRQAAGTNGLLFDQQGRMVSCESRNRRVTRTEADGSITILTDNYEGKKYNSPNDLTIDSKGRIYFSDPRYGSRDGMEILDSQGRTVEGVYRIDAPGKVTRVITHEVDRPNGLLVAPGDRYLYVAENNNSEGGPRKLHRFNLKADGSIDAGSRRILHDWETGRGPDGFKMDSKGRFWIAAGRTKDRLPHESAAKYKGGIYVMSAEGKMLDFIAIPNDEVTNCAFGGPDLKTLFVTAGGTLWSIGLDAPGVIPYKGK
jgi:gluconolactonase